MKVDQEFSKYAVDYESYNTIQTEVVKRLVGTLKGEPKRILDLGCGSGAVYKKVPWCVEHFIGVDFAQGMLDLHPKGEAITLLYGDFNKTELFERLQKYSFDTIVSASALQWAQDLDFVFKELTAFKKPVALAIFTAGTFATLNKTAKLDPLLRSAEDIKQLQEQYFAKANFELVRYKLEFDSVRAMFRYIKKSGVSGARNILSYKETKELMQAYPLNYLEFEVAFITS